MNKDILKSIENLMSIHRNQNIFNIITLIDEALTETNKNTYYFFIYKDNEIITSCRLIVDKKNNAYITGKRAFLKCTLCYWSVKHDFSNKNGVCNM